MSDKAELFDFVVVGAGISGINCAYRLQTQVPGARFVVLESRDTIGGTWAQFKYPGVRSDSPMAVLGFEWHPWTSLDRNVGSSRIVEYLQDAVSEHHLEKHMRYRHKVLSAHWSSDKNLWDVTVAHDEQQKRLMARWLVMATGYYDHDVPLQTEIPGLENFDGKPSQTQCIRYVLTVPRSSTSSSVLAERLQLRRQENCRCRERSHGNFHVANSR